jgi:imidazoleglycerol phosphate synthase cyclase subunit
VSLATRVVPCLDVDQGRVVKGVRFAGMRDAGDPVECAAAYQDQGADELVILDVSATPEARAAGAATVGAVREVLSIPLTAGGGVRSLADASRLLEAGADKVSVNTAAVLRPGLLTEMRETFGAQCTILAVDAAAAGEGWKVVIRSGRERTQLDAVGWCREGMSLGAGEILLTSWDRDGTGLGYDLDLVAAVAGAVEVPLIASGGAGDLAHPAAAVMAGASAVLVASLLHDAVTTVGAIKQALTAAGVEVRP